MAPPTIPIQLHSAAQAKKNSHGENQIDTDDVTITNFTTKRDTIRIISTRTMNPFTAKTPTLITNRDFKLNTAKNTFLNITTLTTNAGQNQTRIGTDSPIQTTTKSPTSDTSENHITNIITAVVIIIQQTNSLQVAPTETTTEPLINARKKTPHQPFSHHQVSIGGDHPDVMTLAIFSIITTTKLKTSIQTLKQIVKIPIAFHANRTHAVPVGLHRRTTS